MNHSTEEFDFLSDSVKVTDLFGFSLLLVSFFINVVDFLHIIGFFSENNFPYLTNISFAFLTVGIILCNSAKDKKINELEKNLKKESETGKG